MPSDDEPARDAISADLLAMEQVASLSFTQDSVAQVLNMLNSIDAVVVLIIVCAASLAFVVLYNLSNINIAERVKEIATIKVLGFYDPEVYAYVNRESVVLTLIGTLFGLAGGIVLHSFIIRTVEVDAVMFGREVSGMSFCILCCPDAAVQRPCQPCYAAAAQAYLDGGKHESAGMTALFSKPAG